MKNNRQLTGACSTIKTNMDGHGWRWVFVLEKERNTHNQRHIHIGMEQERWREWDSLI